MILALELSPFQAVALLCDEAGTPRETIRRTFSPAQNAATRWLELMQMARDCCFRLALEPSALTLAVLAFDGKLAPDETVIRTPYSAGFEGYNLRRGLQEHLKTPNILLCEALAARALGEEKYGALQNERDWIWIQLGNRVESFAGKAGVHFGTQIEALVLDRDGPLDDAGRRGTLGAFCGRDSFAARCASYGLTVPPAQVFEMVSSNFAAQSLAEDFTGRLAQGLAGATAVLGAKTIVFGGDFGAAVWPHLQQMLPAKLGDALNGEIPILRASMLQNDGAVLGAIALGLNALGLK